MRWYRTTIHDSPVNLIARLIEPRDGVCLGLPLRIECDIVISHLVVSEIPLLRESIIFVPSCDMLAFNELIRRTLYSSTLCYRKCCRSSCRSVVDDKRYVMRDNKVIARCVGRGSFYYCQCRIPTDKGVCIIGNRTGHIWCRAIIHRYLTVCHHLHMVRTQTINIGESNRVRNTLLHEVSRINDIFTYYWQFCLGIYTVIRSVFPSVKTIGILRSRSFCLRLSEIYRLYAIFYFRLLQNDAAIFILKGNLVCIVHNLVVISFCLLRFGSQCNHLLGRSISGKFCIRIIEACIQLDGCTTGI